MGAPDSPVRHRTGIVHCPVRCHATQPLGLWSSWPLAPLSACGTGQSGAPQTCCSDFYNGTVMHCSSVRVDRCALDSRCSLAHQTVRWHTGQSGVLKRSAPAFSREWLVQPCTGLVHCSIPKIQILKFSQTCPKFKMNFKFRFKMFVCKLISTNKI
jgi:hypothetical protein